MPRNEIIAADILNCYFIRNTDLKPGFKPEEIKILKVIHLNKRGFMADIKTVCGKFTVKRFDGDVEVYPFKPQQERKP